MASTAAKAQEQVLLPRARDLGTTASQPRQVTCASRLGVLCLAALLFTAAPCSHSFLVSTVLIQTSDFDL